VEPSKKFSIEDKETVKKKIVAAGIAGPITTACAYPFDIMKAIV